MTVLLFAGKMFACSSLLYGYYYLFLRNKRFHHYNRFFLLLATALSFIIPLIRIPIMADTHNTGVIYPLLNVVAGNYEEFPIEVLNEQSSWATLFSLQNITLLVYIAGAAFLFISMIRSLFYILRLTKKYRSEKWQRITFYNTEEEGSPFSFFRFVFWNKHIEFNSSQGQQILQHELFHVHHLHTADLLFMELVCIAAWFNPLFHLAAKELKAIHEFLADNHASSGNDKYEYAELLVTHTAVKQNLSITNNFFNNHLKRRITMLTQFSNKRYGYRSRIMALPVLVMLFCFLCLQAITQPMFEQTIVLKKTFIVVIDAAHGGIDRGAISDEGITEKDICLDIAKKIEMLSKEYNVKVILTRTGDEIPGGGTTAEGVKKRTAIAKEANADLFISIHINREMSHRLNGFEVYVPSINANPFVAKSNLAGSIISESMKNIYKMKPGLNRRDNKTIYVLDKAACPAVLLICGYMSYPKDLAFISKAQNQESIARGVLESVAKYAAASGQ